MNDIIKKKILIGKEKDVDYLNSGASESSSQDSFDGGFSNVNNFTPSEYINKGDSNTSIPLPMYQNSTAGI